MRKKAGRGRAAPAAPATFQTKSQAPAATELPAPTLASTTVVALVVGACALWALTFRSVDFDLWEHLAIGRAIWELSGVPKTELWTWPTYGSADVNIEWGFQALLWPVWQLGGLPAIYVWNWFAAALAFGLVLVTTRAMGVRGHIPLLLIALGILSYRQRSVGRPETLAAVLLATVICLVELRRQERMPTLGWLPLASLVWANSHISYILGIAVLGIYMVADAVLWLARRTRGKLARELVLVLAVAVGVSFLNPFGWHALAEPFRYAFELRREHMFRGIAELMPLDWGYNLRNGLPFLMGLWLLILLWRASRRRFDLAEALLFVTFTVLTALARRLVGMWVIVAIPFLARGMAEWIREREWPEWVRPPWRRGAIVAAGCVLLSLPELMRPGFKPAIAIDPTTYPACACDVMEASGIRGRSFNHYEFGSYMLWRFWPDTLRLPFMDIRQAGTPALRYMYLAALLGPAGWRELDARMGFDYVLLRRQRAQDDRLNDVLDSDSSWALVFTDDAAALYVRRLAFRSVADSLGYLMIGGGTLKLERSWAAAMADSQTRAGFATELERMKQASPLHSTASSLLAYVAAFEGRYDAAQEALIHAHAIDPGLPRFHERLGVILLQQGRTRDALEELQRAHRRKESIYVDYWLGVAYRHAGELARAREAFARAAHAQPENTAAVDSIRAIDELRR